MFFVAGAASMVNPERNYVHELKDWDKQDDSKSAYKQEHENKLMHYICFYS